MEDASFWIASPSSVAEYHRKIMEHNNKKCVLRVLLDCFLEKHRSYSCLALKVIVFVLFFSGKTRFEL